MEERRSSPRVSHVPVVVHQCVLTHLGKETWLSASATDLSSDGLSLSLSDSLNSGESIYLLASVKPEGQDPRDLSVNGVTSYCRPLDDGRWRVGIRFIDLAPEEKDSWKAFLGL